MSSIKQGLTQSINSRKPSWRSQGSYVARMQKRGYDKDPNTKPFYKSDYKLAPNLHDFLDPVYKP